MHSRRNCDKRTSVFISPGVIGMPSDKAGFAKGALVSDPDGHDVLLIQK